MMSVRPRILLVLLVLLVDITGALGGHPAGARGAVPAAPRYDTSYGNDHFGHWTTDRFGLPAFVYTADEARDPAARWDAGQAGTQTCAGCLVHPCDVIASRVARMN